MKKFSQRFYHFIFYPARIIFALKHPVLRIHGKENIPQEPAILCCNHSAFSDPIWVVFAAHPKRIFRIMAKKELFDIPVLGWLITKVGAFPVDRQISDINAVKTAMQILKSGDKLLIFPEGTTKHKEGDPAKLGAARIALKTKAPILPVYISENKKFRSKVYVIFGEPFTPEPTRTREGYQALAEDIMKRIYALKEKIPNG